MFHSALAALRPARLFARAVFLAGTVLLTGCATAYLDGAVKDIPDSQIAKPARPQPVQVVVEFQTNGVANTRATEHVKPMVISRITSSGMFSDVQEKPTAGGLLSVKINNVALMDDAAKKGFMTGLTFGIAGNVVTDGYVCTVSYLPPGQSTPIVKSSKHAIHTAIGNASAPASGVKAESLDDAVRAMVRQIVGVALNDLSREAAFK